MSTNAYATAMAMGTVSGVPAIGSHAEGTGGDAARAPGTGWLREELAAVGAGLGEKATLVQFSSAFCAPCRATRQVLSGVAGLVPGVAHVEVDAETHLELVRRLKIMRTPTVLVLDADGREVRRASGAPPSRAAVLATLATLMPVPGESAPAAGTPCTPGMRPNE